MKKIILVALLLMNFMVPVKAEDKNTTEVEVNAEAAILMDAKTGQILYAKNGDKKEYPASITKIMTIYLASKLGNLDDQIIVSKEAIDSISRKSSHIDLDENEELSLRDAMYASLMASANDASNVVAEKIGGTIEQFVQLMNDTAKELHANNTNFVNAHGLPDEQHYTTAYDMALITQVALQNETFKKIFGEITYEMEKTNKSPLRIFASGSEMLKVGKNKYEFARGGKIGWTSDAGYTMVTTAKKDDLELIAVVLNCPDSQSRYNDTKKIFDYGFENYKTFNYASELVKEKSQEIIQNEKTVGKISFNIESDFNFVINSQTPLDQISHKIVYQNEDNLDAVEAYLVLYYQDAEVGRTKLDTTLEKYDLSFKGTVLPKIVFGLDIISVVFFILFMVLLGIDKIFFSKRKQSK